MLKNKPTVKFVRMHTDVQLPKYETPGAACFDIRAFIDFDPNSSVIIPARGRLKISTGLVPEIPSGWELKLRGRSGLAFKSGITVFEGTIDSDYRGEIGVLLINNTDENFIIENHERICQGKIQEAKQADIKDAQEVSETERGAGGYGSTGAK